MADDDLLRHHGEVSSTGRGSAADGPSISFQGSGCDAAARLRNTPHDQERDACDAADDGVCATTDQAAGDEIDEAPSRDGSPPSEANDADGDSHRSAAPAHEEVVEHEIAGSDLPSEPLSPEMQELLDEVTAIRSALHGPVTDTADEVLVQIRSWCHRSPNDDTSEVSAVSSARLIPMTPPKGEAQAQRIEALPLVRVVSFDDGVYRGQVKRCVFEAPRIEIGGVEAERGTTPTERFVPHGWGIATSRKGLRRVGQWRDGEQVGVGSLQSAVFLYDGEWRASSGPGGYGIGTFASGATFIGCWHSGKPYGPGRLHTFETDQRDHGWFYGTRCLQPVVMSDEKQLHEACMERHLPAQRFDEQPERGLFLVGQILEDSRLSWLRFAMEQWRRVACGHAIELARRRRADTLATWVEAHAAEQDAIAWHVVEETEAYRNQMASVIAEVAIGRQKHSRAQRVREFHTNKLNSAIFQRDLARRCVVSQEESIALMEKELAEVSTLLEEATEAQAECQRLAEQQQVVKRQIENATVKINALRQQIRHRESAKDHQQQHLAQQDVSRKNIMTPATPSYAKAIHAPRRVKVSQSVTGEIDPELPFVCDVPGCSCGIPRHVFTRVAAALNGD